MKTLFALIALSASAHAATVYAIDINHSDGGSTSLTESAWSGLDGSHSATGGSVGSVTVGGVTFGTASASGTRHRGSFAAPSPDALTGDFLFEDGANAAVILTFGGAGDIVAGTWKVEVWTYDADFVPGDQILGLRTGASENAAATINGVAQADGIVSSNVVASASGPAATFTFLSDGTSSYDIFLRENSVNNRTRMNAVRLTLVPEPSSTALLGLGALALIARRKR